MKKIFYTVAIFCAISFSANAQDKKVDIHQKAVSEATELAQLVNLDEATKQSFIALFEHKHNDLSLGLSPERKAELERIIELKIRATLTYDQMQILDNNKNVLSKLTK